MNFAPIDYDGVAKWVLYEHGHFNRPVAILDESDMRVAVAYYVQHLGKTRARKLLEELLAP
jgi:hypothetical protein